MIRTDETNETLFARQQEMEDHAMAMGGRRFRRKLEHAVENGSEAGVGAAQRLLSEGLAKVEVAFKGIIEDKRRGANRSVAKRWITLLGADVAAYLALKTVLDNIHSRVSVRRAAYDVTELVLDELRYRRFREVEPRLFDYAMTGFTTSSYAHRSRSLDARIHHAQVNVEDLVMTQNERFTVGVKMLDVVREVTGLVQVDRAKVQGDGRALDLVELVATPETLEWLEAGNAVLENLWPVNLPMVMPPIPWAPGQPGGYRFALRAKHRLVRSNSKAHRELVRQAHMPEVYSAVNRVQETAWRVNAKVLEVVEALVARGGGIAGIPESSDKPLPVKPGDIEENETVRRAWRRAASLVHEENHETRIARKCLFDLLNVVNKVKGEDAIWFPHNLDFRGRVYPVTSYLHPQGNDMTKALLQFADGKPVGKEGANVPGAARCRCDGQDARRTEARAHDHRGAPGWVESIEAEVVAIAADPLGHTHVDGRRGALAVPRVVLRLRRVHPRGHELRVEPRRRHGRDVQRAAALRGPVARPAWCRGGQRGALGETAGHLPGHRRRGAQQAGAGQGNIYAAMWLRSKLVDRSLCKRPVMTFGYGSEKFGFSQQLYEKVQDAMHEKGTEERPSSRPSSR
jgi:DNA-directed RNA polymerase